uniref:Uncharacterized protein n=1 Tax=viral metagenome TaxID=1070528 RepID=A0A6C0JSX0_9ZZZZ
MSSKKSPTIQERIEMAKAYWAGKDPNFKGDAPVREILPVKIADLSIPTATVPSKAVTNLITANQNQKELRYLRKKIEAQLKPKENSKIPSEVNQDTIKQLPSVVRSKTESGTNRANFLLECIEWEKEQAAKAKPIQEPEYDPYDSTTLFAPKEEDYFFWSENALTVIAGAVGVSEKDKTEIKQMYEMCLVLFASKHIHSKDKLNIASGFYLSGHLEYCYKLYDVILKCPYTRVDDRTECCKFLYFSGDQEYIPGIEKHLGDIIESDLDDDTRYQTIANYVTNTGISSRYLSNLLHIEEVDQVLLARLFLRFINTEIKGRKTDFYYIVMACEFLLEQDADKTAYPIVCEKLLQVAKDKLLDDRTRADAADVLLNHNIEPFCSQAHEIIQEIGEAGQSELEKTVYSNKENVHKLNDTFSKYIMSNHKKYIAKMPKLDVVVERIEELANEPDEEGNTLSEESLFKIRQSIDRIMMEPTLHTDRKISTCDIFRLVFTIISAYSSGGSSSSKDETIGKTLYKRFLEELEDMANTCSSGHAKRLVNVMVGFTDELDGCFDIMDQFVANIKGRIMATIRNMEDLEKKELILSSMTEKGEDKQPFVDHVLSVASDIEKELCDEFVMGGWLSEVKFNAVFKNTIAKIVK